MNSCRVPTCSIRNLFFLVSCTCNFVDRASQKRDMKYMWTFLHREQVGGGGRKWIVFSLVIETTSPSFFLFFPCFFLKLFINKTLPSLLPQFPHLLNGKNSLSECLDTLGLRGQGRLVAGLIPGQGTSVFFQGGWGLLEVTKPQSRHDGLYHVESGRPDGGAHSA